MARAAMPLQMAFELTRKGAECARDEPNRPVGMATGAAAGDLGEATTKKPVIRRTASAVHKLLETLGDRREPVDARSALPRALHREPPEDARCLEDPAGVLGDDRDHARAHGRAQTAQIVVAQPNGLGVLRNRVAPALP